MSATSSVAVAASHEIPVGNSKAAAAPTPFTAVELAEPATTVIAQAGTMPVGCAAKPAAHEPGHSHATDGAAPPVQNDPAGQGVPAAVTLPAAHADPGAAEQGAHVDTVVAFIDAEKVPGGQRSGHALPTGQKEPAGHGRAAHAAADTAPASGWYTPAGQSDGVSELRGQKVPAGHASESASVAQ